MACTSGTRREHPRRMLKKAVQRSVRRESSNVKGFSEEEHSAVLRFTLHVLPLTVFESEARTPAADFFSILLTGRNNVAKPAPKSFRASCLHPDRFNQPHVISGEGKLFSLEIIFHMLRVRGAGQREHPDLHCKPKDDLCKTGP